MLDRLFNSKSRAKLLRIFVLNESKEFSLPDLSRLAHLNTPSVKRELDNLLTFGLIEKAAETETKNKPAGNRFRVNRDFILFEELKQLVIKAQTINQQELIARFSGLGRIKLLVLTGFFVNSPLSPIDLLLVGRVNRPRLLKEIREIEKEIGKEVNFTCLETAEYIYRRNMTDVFLYDILEGKKIILIDELG